MDSSLRGLVDALERPGRVSSGIGPVSTVDLGTRWTHEPPLGHYRPTNLSPPKSWAPPQNPQGSYFSSGRYFGGNNPPYIPPTDSFIQTPIPNMAAIPPMPSNLGPPLKSPTICGECGCKHAVLECRDCHEVYCESCSMIAHSKGRRRAHTQLFPLTSSMAPVRAPSPGIDSMPPPHPPVLPTPAPSVSAPRMDAWEAERDHLMRLNRDTLGQLTKALDEIRTMRRGPSPVRSTRFDKTGRRIRFNDDEKVERLQQNIERVIAEVRNNDRKIRSTSNMVEVQDTVRDSQEYLRGELGKVLGEIRRFDSTLRYVANTSTANQREAETLRRQLQTVNDERSQIMNKFAEMLHHANENLQHLKSDFVQKEYEVEKLKMDNQRLRTELEVQASRIMHHDAIVQRSPPRIHPSFRP
eukprot:PhF_6_TR8755/c0_g1_i1/m.13806